MDFLNRTVQINVLDFILIGSAIFIIFLLVLYNSIRIKSFAKKQERFFRSFPGSNIEPSLNKFLDRVEEVYKNGIEIENHYKEIDRRLFKCFQKVGVIRYNAFENVGSDLSFAIAMLDGNDDGFVINGVFSRDSSCTYAKPITNGTTKYVLSAEEMQAIDVARKTVKNLQQ